MSGNFSRPGNTTALAAALAIGAGVALPGKPVGTMNQTITAGTAATTTLTTNALTKLVPVNAIVLIASVTGTNVEAYTSTAGAAAGATSIAVTSQTSNKARTAGDIIYLVAYTPYLALITATTAPTNTTLGSEYAATGYARQAIPWGLPSAADPPVTQTTALMTFGPFTAGTGAVLTYASQMQCITAGTQLEQDAWWTLTATRTPANGDSVQVAIGGLTFQNT